MAITYNGTPVTSVLMNGVTYTTIADENGYLYYACNPVCYYGNASVCFEFAGFEYDCSNCGYCARAVLSLNGCHDGNGYICWVGGPRTCLTNMIYYASMGLQLGAISQTVQGCGYCGTIYDFKVIQDAVAVHLNYQECGALVCRDPVICATNTCKSIAGSLWTPNGVTCIIYSPWVAIDGCDYYSKLICTGVISIVDPKLYPYVSHISARLKKETGYTDYNCNIIINPLNSRNHGFECGWPVC